MMVGKRIANVHTLDLGHIFLLQPFSKVCDVLHQEFPMFAEKACSSRGDRRRRPSFLLKWKRSARKITAFEDLGNKKSGMSCHWAAHRTRSQRNKDENAISEPVHNRQEAQTPTVCVRVCICVYA